MSNVMNSTRKSSLLSLFIISILSLNIYGAEPFAPEPRSQHSSVLVDSKLYVLGGKLSDQSISSELFYLDLSKSFTTSNVPWKNLPSIPVQSCSAAAAVGGSDNLTIYLFGGIMRDPTTSNPSFNELVYTFDTNSQTWGTPLFYNDQPSRRYAMSAEVTKDEKIFIYGGMSDSLVGSNTTTYYQEMVMFNTVNSNGMKSLWTVNSSSLGSPPGRIYYSATILSDGTIYYIGGLEKSGVANINEIWIYNTTNASWNSQASFPQKMVRKKLDKNIRNNSFNLMQNASGINVANRYAHTAVATIDNERIIIYGGTSSNNTGALPILAVLNVSSLVWFEPYVDSSLPSLLYHTAVISGHHMILIFGITAGSNTPSSNVYVIDTDNNYNQPRPGDGNADLPMQRIRLPNDYPEEGSVHPIRHQNLDRIPETHSGNLPRDQDPPQYHQSSDNTTVSPRRNRPLPPMLTKAPIPRGNFHVDQETYVYSRRQIHIANPSLHDPVVGSSMHDPVAGSNFQDDELAYYSPQNNVNYSPQNNANYSPQNNAYIPRPPYRTSSYQQQAYHNPPTD
ncbi:16811_t:CDS:2 [Acaulospora colombiana]|uniref:16811_t:CDS:1 n=1 Tax=Acaulospora colombiana TaxID=27376 RepID=A0ACA9KJH1_9GLOM|nr:16811_t:CDS:2 [Acaulospora colombiana]